ncbi:hypothetical protein EH240_36225 [Mesorhizobium tamadayense]|uniref:Uncharacterized protein n=1 Tax=Mesorhizobium tamadayense TaxID=425306 RepID=A0A3P3ELZ0_9HYPH|nr:hypothetical protein [Mesorhizobium tamadayense]RRH87424.1 hypothetical protein EH240_36225 [Mesorhizobium tamadayense]
MRLAFSLPILAAIGLAGATAVIWLQMKGSVPETIQGILDQNLPGNTLKMAYLDLPISAAIPLVGPAKSGGYFMIERKGGSPLAGTCAATTIDYEVRAAGNGRLAVSIPGPELTKALACQ